MSPQEKYEQIQGLLTRVFELRDNPAGEPADIVRAVDEITGLVEGLHARVGEAEENLARYGGHMRGCDYGAPPSRGEGSLGCTCGWDAVRAKLKGGT